MNTNGENTLRRKIHQNNVPKMLEEDLYGTARAYLANQLAQIPLHAKIVTFVEGRNESYLYIKSAPQQQKHFKFHFADLS